MRSKIITVFTFILTFGMLNIYGGSTLNGYLDYYGHVLPTIYDQKLHNLRLINLSQKEITTKLKAFRNLNLTLSIDRLNTQADKMKMDDLAVVLLTDKLAASITHQTVGNEQVFIKYLLLKDLGYDVILTRTGKTLNCFGNLSFSPGRFIYVKYNNKTYKDLNFKNRVNKGKHLIYKDSHVTHKSILRNKYSTPLLNAKKKSKRFQIIDKRDTIAFEAISNLSKTEYLADIPMYTIGQDFTHLECSDELNESITKHLRQLISGRSVQESVQFLLAFVQQVTPYGSDYSKYGEERYYYPEETIMASTADCEDKAILLAYLCDELLGLHSMGLYFENDKHLSIAIEIPGYNPTGSFKYAGKTYVSCEPTAKKPVLAQSHFALTRVTEVIPL